MIWTLAASPPGQIVLKALPPIRTNLPSPRLGIGRIQVAYHARAGRAPVLANVSCNCCRCFDRRGCFVVRSGGGGPWWPRLGTRLDELPSLPSKSNNFRSKVLRLWAGGPGQR